MRTGRLALRTGEGGVVFWVPRGPFTVDSVTYDIENRGQCHLQPMISLKALHDSNVEWDSPHLATGAMLAVCREEWPEWRDITWDPDITF